MLTAGACMLIYSCGQAVISFFLLMFGGYLRRDLDLPDFFFLEEVPDVGILSFWPICMLD